MTNSTTSGFNGEFSSDEIPCRLTKPVRLAEQTWPENTDPVLIIFCLTYNHGKFIREAIEGFLMQETTFPVVIFIHDDASTDGTDEIIREYARRYPHLFQVSLQKENQFEKNNPAYFARLLCEQQGEFIALCEGDDRWTDPEKLQRQVDFLEKNSDFTCCFHQTKLVDENNAAIREDYFSPVGSEFDFRDCLVKLKKKYATCSMVFKREALGHPKPWFLKSPTDMFLELQLALSGKIRFIDRNMGVYRKHGGGIWMGIPPARRNMQLWYRYQLLLDDPVIRESYCDEISQLIEKIEQGFCLKKECAEILCRQSLFYRIAWFLDCGFKYIYRHAKNIKRSIPIFSQP
jgi:glycosyltransferase involved in cell wall biosynthesis